MAGSSGLLAVRKVNALLKSRSVSLVAARPFETSRGLMNAR